MMVGGVVLSKSDDDLMRMIFMLLVDIPQIQRLVH